MKKKLLIVFTKNPVLGKVKTRLAKTLGEEQALRIFKKLLSKSSSTAKNWAGDVWVFYSDFLAEKDIWTSVAQQKLVQNGEGLGERMAHAFKVGFSAYEKIVLIGTDIPEISPVIIDSAFEVLRQNDFVLGPTYDGGYYLIGMNDYRPYVFENMVWSTSEVCTQSQEKIKESNHSCQLVQRLKDIDFEADLIGCEWLLE